MNIGTHSRKSHVVAVGVLGDVDETYDTVLLVLPERENIRMSCPDAQRLGYALFNAQGINVTMLSEEKR